MLCIGFNMNQDTLQLLNSTEYLGYGTCNRIYYSTTVQAFRYHIGTANFLGKQKKMLSMTSCVQVVVDGTVHRGNAGT